MGPHLEDDLQSGFVKLLLGIKENPAISTEARDTTLARGAERW